jgi:hypothetical protein
MAAPSGTAVSSTTATAFSGPVGPHKYKTRCAFGASHKLTDCSSVRFGTSESLAVARHATIPDDDGAPPNICVRNRERTPSAQISARPVTLRPSDDVTFSGFPRPSKALTRNEAVTVILGIWRAALRSSAYSARRSTVRYGAP